MAKTAAIEQTPNTGIENLKSSPARLGAFLKDVRSEMRKVIWPSQGRGSRHNDDRSRHGLHLCGLLLAGRQYPRPHRRCRAEAPHSLSKSRASSRKVHF